MRNFTQNTPHTLDSNKNTPSTTSEIKSLLVIILLALCIRTFLLEIFYVPTGSMKETILEGDYIFSTKYNYGFSRYSFPFSPNLFKGRVFANKPTPGDVIIMRPPHDMNTRYIKRLIGMPGDKIEIINDLIYINDKPIVRTLDGSIISENGEKFLRFKETLPNGVSYFIYQPPQNDFFLTENTNFGPYHIEEGKYFFLGDNRYNSADSRYKLGTVPFENFIAKGQFIIFSSAIPLWDSNLGIKDQITRIWDWIKSIRLSRSFTKLYDN
ncbi:MAG: signal peptidase I [Rickettsiaceae bacterium]|nr:signal peptidase I [Rickettsiaceae bacterium]MCP5369278.1 signal peptidase I [Rickettsiaceae bacterium]